MSKNFELLQQVSEEKELYDTATERADTNASDEPEPGSPVSEKVRKEVPRNSSLPDVLKLAPDEPT